MEYKINYHLPTSIAREPKNILFNDDSSLTILDSNISRQPLRYAVFLLHWFISSLSQHDNGI